MPGDTSVNFLFFSAPVTPACLLCWRCYRWFSISFFELFFREIISHRVLCRRRRSHAEIFFFLSPPPLSAPVTKATRATTIATVCAKVEKEKGRNMPAGMDRGPRTRRHEIRTSNAQRFPWRNVAEHLLA